MIEVRYAGRLGNNLFQYALGRILAEELGFELKVPSIAGFPGTAEKVRGISAAAPEQVLHMHEIPFQDILLDRSPRKIVLDGFFQRYEYYRPYKERVRRWLSGAPVPKRDPREIVVHVRKGDYLEARSVAPFSYYQEALANGPWSHVFVCTDTPKDPLVRLFIKKYKASVHHSAANPLSDLRFIMSFDNIVQSASSFSWWASFLSDANRIYTPIPLTGYWSAETPDLDLKVDDEPRYIYIRCKETYRATFAENAYLFRKQKERELEHLRHRLRDRVCTLRNRMRSQTLHHARRFYDRAQGLKMRVRGKLSRLKRLLF